MSIRTAIEHYIEALAARKRPCTHEWVKLHEADCSAKINPEFRWKQFTYRCTKCCEAKRVTTKIDE